VSSQQPTAPPSKRSKRQPLLFQQRLNEQLFWPSILTIAACAALLVLNPEQIESHRQPLMVVMTSTGAILVLTFIFRLRAYAQCLPDGLHVQLPLSGLTIPYSDIKSSRPTELYRLFPPERQNWSQRRFLQSLLGKTVVVMEMQQLPRSHLWLRLWMSKYMLCPDSVGLVLAVRNWMAFRAELDEFRARTRYR
jgi:hypothetical protein